MSDNTIAFKRTVDREEAAAYLEALAKSMRGGEILVEHGDRALNLAPPSAVALEIEAKQKKDKVKFSFEIAWKHLTEGAEGASLKISSPAEAPAEGETPGDA